MILNKNIKRIISISMLVLLVSCQNSQISDSSDINSSDVVVSSTQVNEDSSSEESSIVDLTFYSTNDFHGAVSRDESKKQSGLAYIAGEIASTAQKNPDGVIFVSAGDSYQGSALSNCSYGQIEIDAFNMLGMDAFTVGNHEFDWGVDRLISHHDNNLENGELNAPYLACNIYSNNLTDDTSDDARVNWCQDYEIVYKNGVKIGLIGWIGKGQESDIGSDIIEGYTFYDPLPIISELSQQLKQEQNCDIVVAIGHEGSGFTTSSIAGLSTVDLSFNGHTHVAYSKKSGGTIYMQAGLSGSYLARVDIQYDLNTKKIVEATPTLLGMKQMTVKDEQIDNLIKEYESKYASIISDIIATSGEQINQSSAARWAADVVKEATKADIGIVNSGGIRASGLPISSGQQLTVADFYSVMPFDNVIKCVTLTGGQVMSLMSNTDAFVFDPSFNSENIDVSATYRVAAVDFIFNKSQYAFMSGEDIVDTSIRVRDALVEDAKAYTKLGLEFTPSKGAKLESMI